MSMSRKHYTAIAEAIREAADIDDVIENLCVVLKQDNSNFRAERFRAACNNDTKENAS